MGTLNPDFNRQLILNFPELLEGRSILALSGGIDSMVLYELLRENEIDFTAAHCNFQLRGNDSDQDQKFVEELGRSHDRIVHTKKFDTNTYALEKKLSLQVAARELRYAWFDQLLDNTQSDYLITAHHADDNLETFLIHLSRGSGLKGLTGIPERNGRIRRPLLFCSREEIETYARKKNLTWREDRSNAQSKYLRNRIRNELIPLMKETLPDILKGFDTTVNHLRESQVILNDKLSETWERITEAKGDLIEIDIAEIQSFDTPKAYLYGLLSKFGFTQWQDIQELLSAQSGKMVYSSSHRLLKDRNHLLLQRLNDSEEPEQHEIRKGQNSIELLRGVLKLSCKEESDGTLSGKDFAKSSNVTELDADKVKFPIIVRKWQKGDYFYPKGMQGKKKLSKFFKDEKLSIPEKENIWLLCAENQVAWVVGFRSDDRFKVTDETKRVLHLEWIPK